MGRRFKSYLSHLLRNKRYKRGSRDISHAVRIQPLRSKFSQSGHLCCKATILSLCTNISIDSIDWVYKHCCFAIPRPFLHLWRSVDRSVVGQVLSQSDKTILLRNSNILAHSAKILSMKRWGLGLLFGMYKRFKMLPKLGNTGPRVTCAIARI